MILPSPASGQLLVLGCLGRVLVLGFSEENDTEHVITGLSTDSRFHVELCCDRGLCQGSEVQMSLSLWSTSLTHFLVLSRKCSVPCLPRDQGHCVFWVPLALCSDLIVPKFTGHHTIIQLVLLLIGKWLLPFLAVFDLTGRLYCRSTNVTLPARLPTLPTGIGPIPFQRHCCIIIL